MTLYIDNIYYGYNIFTAHVPNVDSRKLFTETILCCMFYYPTIRCVIINHIIIGTYLHLSTYMKEKIIFGNGGFTISRIILYDTI